MRLVAQIVTFAALALLAGCDSGTPPPKAPPAAPTATVKPAAPAATAKPAALPAGAQPLLGRFATDLSTCGDKATLTTISAGDFTAPGRSCKIALKAGKDGSFSTDCGGAALSLTPVFAPSGEGVNISVGGGKRQTVLRCGR